MNIFRIVQNLFNLLLLFSCLSQGNFAKLKICLLRRGKRHSMLLCVCLLTRHASRFEFFTLHLSFFSLHNVPFLSPLPSFPGLGPSNDTVAESPGKWLPYCATFGPC